jgi:hypothetical protein
MDALLVPLYVLASLHSRGLFHHDEVGERFSLVSFSSSHPSCMSLFLAISTFPLHTFSPQFVRYDDLFTTFHADIPDGKWFLQETLL